jgi:hypothetical protein
MTLDPLTQVLLHATVFVCGLIVGMLIAYREVDSRYSFMQVNKK